MPLAQCTEHEPTELQVTRQDPLHETSHVLTLLHWASLLGPTLAWQLEARWQVYAHPSPHAASQLLLSWHKMSQSAEHRTSQLVMLLQSYTQASAQAAEQRFMSLQIGMQ